MADERDPDSRQELLQKLNRETAKIDWKSLEVHYARGAVRLVERPTDLLQVAAALGHNDTGAVREWVDGGELRDVTHAEVARWHEANPAFWAVVIAPWVLIQPAEAQAH